MRNCGYFRPETPLVVGDFPCQPNLLWTQKIAGQPVCEQIQLAFLNGELYFRRMSLTKNLLAHPDQFIRRHIGPNADETRAMLALLAQATSTRRAWLWALAGGIVAGLPGKRHAPDT